MESNEIFGVAEAALGRVRSDVEALQSEVSLRQQLLRRRKRALAGKERALERTRKAWEAADQEIEQAEEETAAKLTEITSRRDGALQEKGRRRRSAGGREGVETSVLSELAEAAPMGAKTSVLQGMRTNGGDEQIEAIAVGDGSSEDGGGE